MIAADSAVIKEIERLVQGATKLEDHIIEHDARHYTTKELKVILPPQAAPLQVSTLASFAEYVNKRLVEDAYSANEPAVGQVLVHVVDPTNVRLVTNLDDDRRRETLIAASAVAVLGGAGGLSMTFGQFMEAESFNIALQALFVDDDARKDVLRLVGNIREEKVRAAGDDGVSQEVTAKAGVVLVEAAVVPNPVFLAPFRTFREVAQPISRFVLRLKAGREGGLPLCALFEADGGQWKLEAIENIAGYLRDRLPAGTVILA